MPMYPMEAIMKKSRVFRRRFIPDVWFASVGPGRQNQALGCPYVCTIKTVNISAEGPPPHTTPPILRKLKSKPPKEKVKISQYGRS